MKKLFAMLLVVCMLMTSVALAETTDAEPTYTYNYAASEFPTVWDPMRTQTETDSYIGDYIGSGLYTIDYNEDMDGYAVYPLAAVDFPEDVTADYVGEEWGIAEGETARAWKITIREDLEWEDGTPITAKDFEDSAKIRLNPVAQNYRADSFYSGNLVIANAENYAKSGVESDTSLRQIMKIDGVETVEETLALHGEEAGYINWANSFGDTYDFETESWTGAAENEVVDSGLTFAELYTFYTEGAGAEYITWADYAGKCEYALDELFVKYTYSGIGWESVGFKAVDEYSFVIVLASRLEGFYLYYSLTDNWLVKADKYEECITIDGDGVYSCDYGTSVETTVSWGPYKLAQFQSDKVFTLERNDNWFGFNDDPDLYQATAINCDYVSEPATRLEMFLNGQLDVYGLNRDDMETYAASDYTYYSEGDSIYGMVFNPDKGALEANQAALGENVNKTILTLKSFRMAMSLGINRAEFVLATLPTSAPAIALYGSQIVADPDNGIFYRNTDIAKDVVVEFWGLSEEIGEGKTYATVDDAIDSITGYNLEMARAYFDAAYDEAIETGLMDEDDVVTIMIGTPNATSVFYNNGYDFIVNNYTEAVKGTKLEGKLVFDRDSTLGNGFSDAIKNNQVDMLFGVGWTGSTFDPFNLMTAYTSSTLQYDPSWDTSTSMLDIELDGETYTASVLDWTDAVNGSTVTGKNAAGEDVELCFQYSTDADETAQRFTVLAALEKAVLMNYDFIPLMVDASAQLKSMQIEYYTEDEIFPMGRGGVKYMTFNYSDAEWEAYVAEQGGTLNYK